MYSTTCKMYDTDLLFCIMMIVIDYWLFWLYNPIALRCCVVSNLFAQIKSLCYWNNAYENIFLVCKLLHIIYY